MTNIFQLNWRDVLNSCISSVISAVIAYLANATDILHLDPKALLSLVVITFISSLAKKLGTDSEGKFGGVV